MQIKKALEIYIEDTGDKMLTFGENEKTLTDVDGILVKLQQPVIINGKTYGPYLANPRPDEMPTSKCYSPQWNKAVGGKYIGWQITLDSKNSSVRVKPSEEKSCLVVK